MVAVLAACGQSAPPAPTGGAPVVQLPPVEQVDCAPGLPALEMTGTVARSDAKTYQQLPVVVGEGTQRFEVAYGWADNGPSGNNGLTATTLDLGLWDHRGYRTPAAFRGWSGSRQGRLDRDTGPVFVTADSADRGYSPGEIVPGEWSVELGIAAVSQEGAAWMVRVECFDAASGNTPPADPIDPAHIAKAQRGWYAGDFHMHAFHSNANAPDWDNFIAQSRAAQLDFLMITEYITGVHWNQLGAVARANPDLILWPGREIITYFGHANTFGETPDVIDYRHGFEDITLGDVQRRTVAAGALFQVNHPTTFQGAAFENLCRGCAFELGDAIDWSQVHTLEVQNAAARTTLSDVGFPSGQEGQNPFTLTALDYWDERLLAGFKIAGVSGSDSKGVDAPEERNRKGYGSSATMVFAENLSRPALDAAIRAGHVYVRTLGVDESPAVELTITTADGQTGMYGDTVFANSATVTAEIIGGQGQVLKWIVDGQDTLSVPIVSDPFTHEFSATRLATSGPAGTFVRFEIADPQIITVIGNPVWLQDPTER